MSGEVKLKIKTEFENYTRDLEQKLGGDKFRNAVAQALSDTVTSAQEAARVLARRTFDLHTEWVPRGILAIPSTVQHRNATMRSMERHNDFIAAVYFRNAQDPRRSYSFIDDHAVGRTRRPHKGRVAIPSRQLQGYRYKTSRGAVAKRWKPSTLLEGMDASGATYDGTTTRQARGARGQSRGKPQPFKVYSRKLGATVIARRKGHRAYPLEVLYIFRDEARIPQIYDFEREVLGTVEAELVPALRKRVNSIG